MGHNHLNGQGGGRPACIAGCSDGVCGADGGSDEQQLGGGRNGDDGGAPEISTGGLQVPVPVVGRRVITHPRMLMPAGGAAVGSSTRRSRGVFA